MLGVWPGEEKSWTEGHQEQSSCQVRWPVSQDRIKYNTEIEPDIVILHLSGRMDRQSDGEVSKYLATLEQDPWSILHLNGQSLPPVSSTLATTYFAVYGCKMQMHFHYNKSTDQCAKYCTRMLDREYRVDRRRRCLASSYRWMHAFWWSTTAAVASLPNETCVMCTYSDADCTLDWMNYITPSSFSPGIRVFCTVDHLHTTHALFA